MTAQDDCDHIFGPERIAVAHSGPMEGRWIVTECLKCNAFTLQSVEAPEDSLDAVLTLLADLGCDPQPVKDDNP